MLTLADAYDVDLAASFTSTMDELEEIVDVRDAAGPESTGLMAVWAPSVN